jgi:uncharacterized membrane-anchored protein YhcB (DUF1043 family)
MKDIKNDKKSGINPVAAAVTGAVIGAGAVVAGAIAMKDKNNQEKVEKVVNDTKEKFDQFRGKVKEVVEVAKEPMDETK